MSLVAARHGIRAGPGRRGRLRPGVRRAGVVVLAHRIRRLPRSRPGRGAACAAVGTGPEPSPARQASPRSRPPRSGQRNRPARGAARPSPVPRRSRTAAVRTSATTPPCSWNPPRTCRRAPGRSPAEAASIPTSPALGRRSRSTIRPATWRPAGRSRRWTPVRAGPPRTGPRRGRTLTAGGGNAVRPGRPRHPRRLTGTPTRRARTGDGPRNGRPGQPGPPAPAAGPAAAGPAG